MGHGIRRLKRRNGKRGSGMKQVEKIEKNMAEKRSCGAGVVWVGRCASWLAILAMCSASMAVAQAPAAAPAGGPAPTLWGAFVQMLPMLAICYLIFYVMVIRPQEKKVKQHKSLLESLKRGDSVVTSSGLVGRVAGVDKEYVLLEISPNVKVKIIQSHIARLETEAQKAQAA